MIGTQQRSELIFLMLITVPESAGGYVELKDFSRGEEAPGEMLPAAPIREGASA